MLDLSSFHGAAISVELCRMEGLGSGMGATGGRVISMLRFYCCSSGVETPLRKTTGSTCLGESGVSSPDSSHRLDLLGLQGLRGTGLGSGIGNRRHPPTSPP